MTYKYGGKVTIAAEAKRLAAAKREARKELKERRALIQKLRRSRQELDALDAARAHLDAEIRHLSAIKDQPEPIYGGPAGLIAATAESARYDRMKRTAA